MTALELVAIVVAVAAGGFVKAVTGMGLPIVSVPVMALFLGIEDAVVVIAPANVAANAYLCWRHREGRTAAPPLGRFLATGVVGAAVGAWLLSRVDGRWIAGALALALIGYVANEIVGAADRAPSTRAAGLAPVAGGLAGVAQGAAGISGPVVGAWVHSLRLPRRVHVFSVTALFLVLGVTQLVSILVLGLMTGDRALGAAAAAVPVAVATLAGSKVGDGIARSTFDRAVLGVLSAAAVSLGVQSLAG